MHATRSLEANARHAAGIALRSPWSFAKGPSPVSFSRTSLTIYRMLPGSVFQGKGCTMVYLRLRWPPPLHCVIVPAVALHLPYKFTSFQSKAFAEADCK